MPGITNNQGIGVPRRREQYPPITPTLGFRENEICSEQYSDQLKLDATSTLANAESELIRAALVAEHGNRQRAARRLGIGERTLYRTIKKYGL